jgi:hypothetical protein
MQIENTRAALFDFMNVQSVCIVYNGNGVR